MKTSDFDYFLPKELIAQFPSDDRASSRMLVMRRDSGACTIKQFRDVVNCLEAGDCLVINDTRVVPARIFGRRVSSGGKVEALLLEELRGGRWRCCLRPGRRMKPGSQVSIDKSEHFFSVEGRNNDDTFAVRFDTEDVFGLMESAGVVPLPPYIQRSANTEDAQRYQTVYARNPGAVAAPTAGLHFTKELLDHIRHRGVKVTSVTLHVGAGTFRPVKVENLENHRMHAEKYFLPEETAAAVNHTRSTGKRVIAVGTTSVRVLESRVSDDGATVLPGKGKTNLFLHPPLSPVIVDGLLTNFHLPRSTLLMLVCTFSTRRKILNAYKLAVQNQMRFYSYGDCMLLLPD